MGAGNILKIIFAALCFIAILVIVIIFDSYFPKILDPINKYGGLLTFVSLFVAYIVYYSSKTDRENEELAKQKAYLSALQIQAKQALDNCEGQQKELNKADRALPLYPINEISPHFFSTALQSKIGKKSTENLKLLLFKANDKVILINGVLREMFISQHSRHTSLFEQLNSWLRSSNNGMNVHSELKNYLNEINKEVESILTKI